MNKQQSIALVSKTFESGFDKSSFVGFVKNLLNEYDAGEFSYAGRYVPDSFKDYISHYERIGKYTDSKEKRIDILVVYLKKETSIERARSMQRNFIAGYLKGNYGRDSYKDAALVAFVSPNEEDWRFSLVKLEVRLDADDGGRMKLRDEFTPARRWSFLVGGHENSHTAQRQFQPLLEDIENNPTLEKLEEAFNIEKVTREFFEKYRALFIWTKDELDKVVEKDPTVKADFVSKGIDTVNLAKKLLGQIIFLYYLQKKGWFGVPRNAAWGDGSRNFLRDLFVKSQSEKKNFFNDILEPLFYEALRLDRSHDDNYYSRFNCKIPFLNGGLFDPMNNYDWVKTDILLSDELFSNQNKTMEGDTGDGILDIFDRYNFTVKEDEPFEKEVAIDPELLGKAYEKFNAIRPDNYDEFVKALKSGKKGDESKFNKQYGVYYTPREIVHYMCQQSLINYLYSELNPNAVYQYLGDDQLDMFGNVHKGGQLDLVIEHRPMMEISKEDIALLIQHSENWRENEERVGAAGKETDTYSYKIPESIRKNASLIDEKLSAIKVCDPAVGSGAFPVGMMSEIVRARNMLAIYKRTSESLTTYDFKRQCIENSLYGVDIDAGAVEIAKLRLWLSLIVDEDDIQNIKPLPNLDYKIVCGNSLVGFPEKWGSPIENEIESLIHQHFNETNVTQKNELKAKIDEKIESRYKNSIKVFGYQVNFDFRMVFSEIFRQKGGFDIIIGNPPYVQIKGIPAQERRFYERTYKFATGRFNIFYLFIEKTKNLARKMGVVSYIIPDRLLLNTQCDSLRKWLLDENQILEIVSFNEQVFETAVVDSIILAFENRPRQADYINAKTKTSLLNINRIKPIAIPYSYITLSSSAQIDLNFNPDKYLLIKKLLSKSVSLETISESKDGIIQGKVEDNLFITNTIDKDSKPLLFGENIEKYKISFGNYWVNYKPKEMMALEIKRRGEGVRPGLWLRNPTIFERPKILTRQTADEIIAAFDENNYYYANTLHGTAILDNDYNPYYVLGVLNSKVTTWFYRSNTDEEGKTFAQIKIELLRRLPIPKADTPTQKPIIKHVDRILAAKRANRQADTSALEREIDQLVYQLYDLTKDEIAIVDGK